MAKFCTRCGNAIPEDGSPCPSCTAAQQSAAPKTSIGQSIKLDFTSEDDMLIAIGGNRIKVAAIVKVAAVALCVLFFLPLFSVSCQGVEISFNGWNTAFGKTVSTYGSSNKVDGNIAALFLLLIPAALFVAFQFKKNLQFINGKLFLISTGFSALGLIGFIVLAMVVNKQAEENLLIAKYTFWYYLSIILYIVAGLISLWCVLSAKKKAQKSGILPPNAN
ncbi:MAG: hypothetical protein FWF88_03505 [Peptococcaceae bacterium]|nr:hypothetical protein [Peptococcaceae bacterium]